MSTFLTGVPNPMTSSKEQAASRRTQLQERAEALQQATTFKPLPEKTEMEQRADMLTFKPPPFVPNTGIFAPGYGKKEDPLVLLGIKPMKPMRQKGTKTQGAEASVN
tara:strand:- start:11123 stop:11443 length:321 start_codon:yes stop_codon:yes gene_type:complete